MGMDDGLNGIDEALKCLRASVAVMRELGVTKWNDIELGPEPPKHVEARPMTDDEILAAAKEEKKRLDRLLFASAEGSFE